MFNQRRIRGGWTAFIVVAVLLMINCGGGGGGGGGDNGTPVTYSISGAVTSNGVALPGVTVSLTGAASMSTTTDGSGNYQFTRLSSGNYTVTPSIAGYGFTPTNLQETISASDITGVSFDATPNTAWAWGQGTIGQLGDGQGMDSPLPVQVSDLSHVIAIAAGNYYSLALRSDGTVWGWGQGTSGQLGNGGTTNSNTPVQVPGLNNINKIAAGQSHTVAVKSP